MGPGLSAFGQVFIRPPTRKEASSKSWQPSMRGWDGPYIPLFFFPEKFGRKKDQPPAKFTDIHTISPKTGRKWITTGKIKAGETGIEYQISDTYLERCASENETT